MSDATQSKPTEVEVDAVNRSTMGTLLELGVPALIAAIGLTGWIMILDRVQLPLDIGDMFDGTIQHIIVFLLIWHLVILLVRWALVIRPEQAVLKEKFFPTGMTELDRPQVIASAEQARAYELRKGPKVLTRRIILAATNLVIRGDEEALGQLMHRRAEADRQRANDAYAIPQFIFWAIPILGFIGTVVGIGMAISGLGATQEVQEAGVAAVEGAAAINVNSTEALQAKIGDVADNLSLAFDTTQVALILSIIALLFQTLVNRAEMRLFDDIDDALIFGLESRLAPKQDDQTKLLMGLKDLTKSLEAEREERKDEHKRFVTALSSGHKAIAMVLESMPKRISVVRETMDNAIASIREQMGQVIEGVDRSMTPALERLDEKLATIAQTATEALVTSGDKVARELAEQRAGVSADLAQSNADSMAQVAEKFSEHTEPLISALQQNHALSEKIYNQAKELEKLEVEFNRSMQEVGAAGKLDQVLVHLDKTLGGLEPALDRLGNPVPVKLSLVGVEAEAGMTVDPIRRTEP